MSLRTQIEKTLEGRDDMWAEDVYNKAVKELTALFESEMERVIGTNEREWESGMGIGGVDLDRQARNELRKEQRQRVEELLEG